MENIDFGFTPSPYQEQIFDFIRHGTGNAVIRAYAGSGKTKTIVSAMKLVPKTNTCLFIAFNKSIVEELTEKLNGYDNCCVKTLHSLGFAMCKRNLEKEIEVDEYKYRGYIKNNICAISEMDCEKANRQDIDVYIDTVCELVQFARYNLCQTEREIGRIAEKYEIPIKYDELSVTVKCLKWGKEHTDVLDYTDMVWLPYELSMNPRGFQYDYIFADEVQDFSKAYVDLMLRCFKRGTRFTVVGDQSQCINQFSGSSNDAFEYMCSYPNTKIFSLPISYRCDKSIIEMARQFVPDIQWRDDAGDGKFINECFLAQVKNGDMILARSKAPLAKVYTKLLKRKVKCYIKGHDLADSFLELLNSIDAENLNRELFSDGVFPQLYDRMFTYRNQLMDTRNMDLFDASLSRGVLNMYDNINTLMTLSEGLSTKTELIDHIEKIFVNDGEGICLSTIHKAKGLEADNVYILCRSTMPPKRVERKWEIEQEQNLIYVAYTRAKHILGFISEKECPPAGILENDEDIINAFKFYESKVCSILGKEPKADKPSVDLAEFRLRTATDIPAPHENDNVIIISGHTEDTPNTIGNLDDLLANLS